MFSDNDYQAFLDMLTSAGIISGKYKPSRYGIVAYCIGYYGCLSVEVYEMINKAFEDGYISA